MRALVCGAALALCVPAVPALARQAQTAIPAEAGRQVTELSQGWRFRFGAQDPAAVSSATFDDGGWEAVSVPHTWNRMGEYALKRTAAANNAQGQGWYRLRVNAPAAAKGQRQYLDFAAVGTVAHVWVNGRHVGEHKGAFARFRLDVSPAWKPGAENLIVVCADNSKPAPGSATEHVIPLAGDFFVHGGIYRGVTLITAGEAGIDLLDKGGPGVYVRTPAVSAEAAEVIVMTRLRNAGSKRRKLRLVATLADPDGRMVAQARQAAPLRPGATEVSTALRLANPRLWNGTADPALYRVNVDVIDEKGAVVDRVSQPFGVRTVRFDADKGFFLNGRHVKLRGVSRHQDRAGKGWALSDADHAQDMALVRELGANTIRQAHYQHADAWSDEADKAGMVVWAELPYVAAPSLTGGKGSPELWANAEQQLRELIRQNYNHPAIAMWSIGNEVDSAQGFGFSKAPPEPLALLTRLNALAKAEDPTRPTIFADCCDGLQIMANAGEKLPGAADLIGYNRYFGWYMPKPLDAARQFAEHTGKLHAAYPALPMSISEYGAGGSISQHSDDIGNGFVNFIGRPQPEEFEAWVHEQVWPEIAARDHIFASWVWAMFDFTSDLREEGDAIDLNTKGLMTADRGERKDAFHYYKAAWRGDAVVALAGRHYPDRAYPAMDIKAYTNATSARLSLNGRDLGEARCANFTCVWPQTALSPGANLAEVTAIKDGAAVSDRMTWTGPDPQAGIRIDAGDLAGRVLDGRRFGSDTFVTGGAPMVLNLVGFGGRRLMPARTVTAPAPELYDYWREGEAFSYAIPVPDGRWTVTLHLFEPSPAPGAAQALAVSANGKAALPAFNVAKAAGGALRGVARTFAVTVRGGVLRLDLASTGGKAALAAIEVSR